MKQVTFCFFKFGRYNSRVVFWLSYLEMLPHFLEIACLLLPLALEIFVFSDYVYGCYHLELESLGSRGKQHSYSKNLK